MPELNPNDIGLATYADVGDVSELRTSAKTIVSAINELCSANGVTPILGEQVYVDGKNNVIIGTGNVVRGSNNLIVGSDNLVISDGAIVFKNGIRLCLSSSFSLTDYNVDQRKIVYDYDITDPTFVIGTKIAFKVCQTWMDSNYQNSITKELPFQVCICRFTRRDDLCRYRMNRNHGSSSISEQLLNRQVQKLRKRRNLE